MFSWNGLLVFSGTQHGFRGACGVMHDRAGFFLNNIFDHKMGKIGQRSKCIVLDA